MTAHWPNIAVKEDNKLVIRSIKEVDIIRKSLLVSFFNYLTENNIHVRTVSAVTDLRSDTIYSLRHISKIRRLSLSNIITLMIAVGCPVVIDYSGSKTPPLCLTERPYRRKERVVKEVLGTDDPWDHPDHSWDNI